MTKQTYVWLPLLTFLCVSVVGQETETKIVPNAQTDTELTPAVTEAQPMSFWMEKKLDYSKRILEALTSGRHEDIEAHAEKMRVLGKIEGFVRGRSASYTTHLQSFDLATRELQRNARAKNTEGATLAFHQLTTSCVACHQSLRSVEP